MLPSLRPLIAESMRSMSAVPFFGDYERLQAGARTLEWCDANDPDGDQRLTAAFDDVRAALVAWNTSISKKRHAELKDEIDEILAGIGL